jgi:hypothetical protein
MTKNGRPTCLITRCAIGWTKYKEFRRLNPKMTDEQVEELVMQFRPQSGFSDG